MTTTPTLYVQTTTQLPSSNLKVAEIRPATHDELIAAMPRCGTCDRWKKQGRVFEDGDFVNVGLCSRYDMIPREDYGCTDHIPISNQSTE